MLKNIFDGNYDKYVSKTLYIVVVEKWIYFPRLGVDIENHVGRASVTMKDKLVSK